jgi:hypothetical protein
MNRYRDRKFLVREALKEALNLARLGNKYLLTPNQERLNRILKV